MKKTKWFIPLIFLGLAVMSVSNVAYSQIKKGVWHCVEARYNQVAKPDFDATFEIVDGEYYKTTFSQSWNNGDSKARYRISSAADTFYTSLPADIPTTYGGRSMTQGGKLLYSYYLSCPQDLWTQYGQTAIGYGWPAGAKESFILIKNEGDTLLRLKSPDQKTVLTYTYGAKRPLHNYVTFSVDMRLQNKLGYFNASAGDQVLLRGSFNNWSGTADKLTETTTPGIYSLEKDFPPTKIDSTFEYLFVIRHANGSELKERQPNRSFTLQAGGQNLGVAFFDRRGREDDANTFAIAKHDSNETAPAVAYDRHKQQYLVVWVETQNKDSDIWGRLFDKTGAPVADRFLICGGPGSRSQQLPQVKYMTATKQYMVVWQDDRFGNWDIRGIVLDANGRIVPTSRSLSDGSFAICDHSAYQYTPRLSYNSLDTVLLCVWYDYRNQVTNQYGSKVNLDVYGQRLRPDGRLLLPGDSTDSKVNYPIAVKVGYNEYSADVGYYGRGAKTIDEWLVVFAREDYVNSTGSEIWGVRVNGKTGKLVNTYGQIIEPALAKSEVQPSALVGPPWLPEFPIAYNKSTAASFMMTGGGYRGSPHVGGYDISLGFDEAAAKKPIYPVPEFLVAWTDFIVDYNGNIYCQRLAYFDEATAIKRGFKPAAQADTTYTLVLLDQKGKPPAVASDWKTWQDFPVCIDPYPQSYNSISYSLLDGTFLVTWNDWRRSQWDGSSKYSDPKWTKPPADIYGQRLCIDPNDSSLLYVEHDGSKMHALLENTPIAYTDFNEGNSRYPAMTWGSAKNEFFIGYEYSEVAKRTDIYATLYNGKAPFPSKVTISSGAPLTHFNLRQNYPNPFNPETTIEWDLDQPSHVQLRIYNGLGQCVAILADGDHNAGHYSSTWSGMDSRGLPLPSGVYFYRLEVNDRVVTKKMVLMR